VPLARIKELLSADPDEFAGAIAEIDRNLQERATSLHSLTSRPVYARFGWARILGAQDVTRRPGRSPRPRCLVQWVCRPRSHLRPH
jgi:hypothetical protein